MSKQRIHWKHHFIELMVVIFGITIAFSIDKIAEQRKEAREMKVALESIMDDLRSDVQLLEDYQIPNNQEQIDQLEYIITQLKQENYEDDSLPGLIAQSFGSMNTLVNNATFESLKSSGKLEDIPNVRVRRRIVGFYHINYSQTEYLSQSHLAFAKQLQDYVSGISSAFFTGDFRDRVLLTDPGFRSLLARWRNMIYFKVSEYKRLSKESQALVNFMEKELN